MELSAGQVKRGADNFLQSVFREGKEFKEELLYEPKVEDTGRWSEEDLFNPQARPDAPPTIGGMLGSTARHLTFDSWKSTYNVVDRALDAQFNYTHGIETPKEEGKQLAKDLGWEVGSEVIGALLPFVAGGMVRLPA